MSFIAGALLKNPNNLQLLDKFITRAQQDLIPETCIINRQPYAILIGGKKEGASSAEKVQILGNNEGLLAGRIFEKSTNAPGILNDKLTYIESSKGKWLSDHYWGSYILAFLNNHEKTITIFRDPQGLSTVFIAETPEMTLFSCDSTVLYDVLEVKPELDWSYLTSFVAGAHNITYRTPFKNITELFPGYGIKLSAQAKSSPFLFWDPTILSHSYKTEQEYEDALISTFYACTEAWTKELPNIGIELSGGVDSSSVAMALKDRVLDDKKIISFNFYHPAVASSDERKYAEKVAHACKVELQCVNLGNYLPFSKFPTKRIDKPASFLLDHALNSEMAQRAQVHGNLEFVCGQGGDHLFMAPPPVESIADYFLLKGYKGITTKIKDISAYYRMPLVRVLTQNFSTLIKYRLGTTNNVELLSKPSPWMNSAFQERLDKDIFKVPFWDKLKHLPPAKVRHIIAIYQATLYIDRGHKIYNRPILNPFLSQPLVELALSLPTYQLYTDGYDRAPFRRGMYKATNHDYIWRKTKGETSGIIMLGLSHNLKNICELVLEGRFVKEKLVDKELLYDQLQELRHGKGDTLWPLINLLAAELWFNTWGDKINFS